MYPRAQNRKPETAKPASDERAQILRNKKKKKTKKNKKMLMIQTFSSLRGRVVCWCIAVLDVQRCGREG